jgi:cation diffusion facilitator family transporter
MANQSVDKFSSLQRGVKVAKLSALVMALLGLAKGIVGLLSGSVALLADAVHSLSDVFASLAVWFGLKFAQKKPTERFPYGYYKAETLASLMISLIILFSGVEIMREALLKFWNPMTISFPFIVLPIPAISAASSYLLSKYKERTGKEINSQALVGEGKHSMVDVYSSIIVLVGVIFSYLGFAWVEAFAGLVISLLVVKLGLWLAKDTVLVLMDACLDPNRVSKMKEVAKTVPGVKGIHAVKIRRSGPYIFGEMHVDVQEKITVEKAHEISEEIERRVKESIKEIDSLITHMEPAEIEKFRVAIPVDENKGLESTLNPHLGAAPYFLLVDVDRGQVVNWFVEENPGVKLERKRGIAAADFLVKHRVDVLVTGGLGEGPFHVLKDGFVKVYKMPDGMRIQEILGALQQKALQSINAHE